MQHAVPRYVALFRTAFRHTSILGYVGILLFWYAVFSYITLHEAAVAVVVVVVMVVVVMAAAVVGAVVVVMVVVVVAAVVVAVAVVVVVAVEWL